VKHVTLEAAIAEGIPDGSTIYMAGFSHLIPFAAGLEIIRQQKRDLTLCRATPDLLYDMLIAAGTARHVVFSYAGNPGVGLLPAFRRAVETGAITIEEYTHYEMTARLAAGAAHLPFWPLKVLETDVDRMRGGLSTVTCPFTGASIPVVPALQPDVTVLHAQAADDEGNVYVWGLTGEMKEAALAAHTVIATVEEILPATALRRWSEHLLIPGFLVSAVATVPWGAYPSYALGYYDRDTSFYQEWDRLARDVHQLAAWLDQIRETSHARYVQDLEARGVLARLCRPETERRYA
jgi:glutaconate CoA-transferase subunit A